MLWAYPFVLNNVHTIYLLYLHFLKLNQGSLFNFVTDLWASLGIFDFNCIKITDFLILKLQFTLGKTSLVHNWFCSLSLSLALSLFCSLLFWNNISYENWCFILFCLSFLLLYDFSINIIIIISYRDAHISKYIYSNIQ